MGNPLWTTDSSDTGMNSLYCDDISSEPCGELIQWELAHDIWYYREKKWKPAIVGPNPSCGMIDLQRNECSRETIRTRLVACLLAFSRTCSSCYSCSARCRQWYLFCFYGSPATKQRGLLPSSWTPMLSTTHDKFISRHSSYYRKFIRLKTQTPMVLNNT